MPIANMSDAAIIVASTRIDLVSDGVRVIHRGNRPATFVRSFIAAHNSRIVVALNRVQRNALAQSTLDLELVVSASQLHEFCAAFTYKVARLRRVTVTGAGAGDACGAPCRIPERPIGDRERDRDPDQEAYENEGEDEDRDESRLVYEATLHVDDLECTLTFVAHAHGTDRNLAFLRLQTYEVETRADPHLRDDD